MDSASYQDLIEQLRALGPFEDAAVAESALAAVLNALGGRLMREERGAIGRLLPEQCAQMVLSGDVVGDGGLFGVIHDVAQAEHISLGRAAEYVDIVTRAVVGLADDQARALLVRAVPELDRVLEACAPQAPTPAADLEQDGDTLASGRPGSRRPISSSH